MRGRVSGAHVGRTHAVRHVYLASHELKGEAKEEGASIAVHF